MKNEQMMKNKQMMRDDEKRADDERWEVERRVKNVRLADDEQKADDEDEKRGAVEGWDHDEVLTDDSILYEKWAQNEELNEHMTR